VEMRTLATISVATSVLITAAVKMDRTVCPADYVGDSVEPVVPIFSHTTLLLARHWSCVCVTSRCSIEMAGLM